jgi:putative tricarboxylic transport membrane protein
MDLLANLIVGFETALRPETLLYCFVGVFLGTFIGVLPGIGSLAAISMLLPVSFYLDPTTALVLLAGVYYGAEYGGSTAAILLNLPGTPSSAVSCLDGYPMGRQGRAGVALFATTIASFMGGCIGIVVLIAFAPALGSLALAFGPAEYFSLMVLGLIAAAAVAQGSPLKGVIMVVFGLMLSQIGTDVDTGRPRFTMGFSALFDGVNLVAVAMGLFGVSEVISSILMRRGAAITPRVTLRSMIPTRDDVRRSVKPMLRGAGIGSFFGALPGTGQTVASFISYAWEKRTSRTPDRFGNGAIEGLAAPESANNAATQTAFIPTLTLGIPGSATMALMLGALMIHGVTPGPTLITNHPTVFWGLIASFWIGNLMLLVLNIPLIGLWVRLLLVPYRLLYPAILVLICIGVYSINNNVFDIYVVLLMGVAGYGLRLLGFEPAPMLIGFVLGPMLEENLRRAMLLARGDVWVIVQRPMSATMLGIAVLLLVWAGWSASRARRMALRSNTVKGRGAAL